MKKAIVIMLIVITAVFAAGCAPEVRLDQTEFSVGADIVKRISDENFTQEVTGVEGSGTTFYCSDDESVATINPYSGEIDVLSEGTTYITVTNTGDSYYKPVTGIYKLTVAKNEFITTWSPAVNSSSNKTITIPVYDAYDYNYVIDWGDGDKTTGTSKSISHEYDTAGVYTITILGTFPGICLNNSEYADTLLSIENWGAIEWQSMNAAFYGCDNLTCRAQDVPNVTAVTDMDNAFNGATLFSGQNLSMWDVTSVATHTGFSDGWGAGNTEPTWP